MASQNSWLLVNEVDIPEHVKHKRQIGLTSAIFFILNKIIGTGIFSLPSSVYKSTGSVGWSILLWIFGGVASYAGLNVYLEFGLEIPKSGGEKNYLERIYRRPKHLALSVFAIASLLMNTSAANSYTFGLYTLLAMGVDDPSPFHARIIAVVCISLVVFVHSVYPRIGRLLFNSLGMFKVGVLFVITFSGAAVWSGLIDLPDQPDNFKNAFQNDGFGGGSFNYAIAILRILYAYKGWDNCNAIMGEIKNPARTMGLAGPLAIGLITILYTACTLAYFVAVPKQQIANSGAIIAGKFFFIIFGKNAASRVLPLCVSLSNLGNVLVVSYAGGAVTHELGKHHFLPFSSAISSLSSFGTPMVALGIYWFFTVAFLVLPPPGEVYEFIVDLQQYPYTLITCAVTGGLLYLQYNHVAENWGTKKDRYRSPLPLTLLYFITNIFLIIMPWIPPPEPTGSAFPYYSTPLAGIVILALGPLYWLYWRRTRDALLLDEEISRGEYLVID
jgi:amino acid transporter